MTSPNTVSFLTCRQPSPLHQRLGLAIIALLFFSQITRAQEQDTTSLKEVFSQFSLKSLLDVRIVTVSKKEETIFDAPLASSVVTGEEIKQAGATSVMEALRLVPGLIVREQSPGNFDIHIRGYDAIDPLATMLNTINTITLVMINNRIVYNDAQGGTLWETLQIGIDDIDRIEVVRGPAAALYGPNAAAGVINILTKRSAKKGFSVGAYSQGGAYSTYLLNGSLGYEGDDGWSVRVGGNLDNRLRHYTEYYRTALASPLDNDIILEPGGYRSSPDSIGTVTPTFTPTGFQLVRGNQPYNSALYNPNIERAVSRYSFNGQLGYKQGETELNLLGGYALGEVQRFYAATTPYMMTSERNYAAFGHLYGRTKALSFSADINRGENSTFGTPAYSFSFISATVDYNIDLAANLSVKPGVAYRYNDFSETATLPRSNLYTASAYLRAEYLVGQFRFIGGARIDQFRVPNRAFFSPQLAVTYKPSDDVLLRASYGRSARTPFITSVFGDIKPSADFPFDLTANPNQQLLTIDAIETGGRFNLGGSVSADLEVFYSQGQNFESLVYDSLSTTFPGFATVPSFAFKNTSQRASQIGATISLTALPLPTLRLQGFITVQQTRITNYSYKNPTPLGTSISDTLPDNAIGFVSNSFTHRATPTVFGGMIANYAPTKRLNINFNSYYYGNQTLTLTSAGATDSQSANFADVRANFLLNAAINYEVADGVKVLFNWRGLAGGNERQFGFGDRIAPTFSAGLNVLL